MSQALQCADAETLGRFLLGRCSSEEVERLAEHVGSCARCAEVLQTLQNSDELVAAVQAGPSVLREPPTELVERLCALRPEDHTTIAGGASWLLGQLRHAPSETTQELYAFLAPPRQPGEIGWLGAVSGAEGPGHRRHRGSSSRRKIRGYSAAATKHGPKATSMDGFDVTA
jgi:hypothetical protein